MNKEILTHAEILYEKIRDIRTEITTFKNSETDKVSAFDIFEGYDYLPDQLIEQIYYLILSALEDEKEKLEKEFEAL